MCVYILFTECLHSLSETQDCDFFTFSLIQSVIVVVAVVVCESLNVVTLYLITVHF